MSPLPEITVPEAISKKLPALNTWTKTSTSVNGQTSDKGEIQDSTSFNTQNEPPKKDSSDGRTKQEDAADTHPKQDSTTHDTHFESKKQDSTNADPNSKKDAPCLPLSGLFPQKGAKSKFNLASVPENTYSKEELAKSIEADIKYIQDEANRLDNYKSQVDYDIQEALKGLKLLKEDEDQDLDSLRDLKKAVTKLKLQIPKQKADIDDKDPHKDHHAGPLRLKRRDIISEKVMKQLPRLYNDNLFLNSSEFKHLKARLNQLPVELKLCLLCFSIFPGNEDIKKRLMVYWWMTEGFVPPIPRDEETRKQIADGKTAEEFADEFFEKLTEMGFVEPVNKKRSLSVGSYRMHPFVRTALIMLAEEAKFFEFDDGEPTEKFSESLQASLVGRGLIDYQDLRERKVKVQDLEKLHAVINVNEPILELKKEWLLEMKNVNILYLGRWKASGTHHIEVEDEEEKDFLDGLQNMSHLKFFSLQGISRIMELPESISKLSNLMILDLRACHNLESIPEKIGLLKNLTHLDISECYLLERMPKAIASLSELRILKGFVAGERSKYTCNLEDLAKLRKLIKLTIYTGLVDFPEPNDIEALQKFKMLRKLTIAWGGGALKVPSSKSAPEVTKRADGGVKKEISKAKQGGSASQAKSNKASKPPNPDGRERKENIKEIQGGDVSKLQSSITTEAPTPDGGERENEKTREKQGDSASQAQSSKNSEPPQTGNGGNEQKDTPKEIQEEGNLQTQSSKSTAEAPVSDDGVEKQKNTTKGIEEGDVLQASSSKSTSEVASKPVSGGKEQATKEIQGKDALQASSSKSSAEAPKQNGGKGEKKKTRERQKTLGKSVTLNRSTPQQLKHLEKLDLKSFPKVTTPDWLMPSTLKSLKKLYIRGGKFSDLGQYQDIEDWRTGGGTKQTWNVEILRLKYLSELEMDWRELQELFPNLVYLDKVNCPKLSFFPCDGYGVWINRSKLKQMQDKA